MIRTEIRIEGGDQDQGIGIIGNAPVHAAEIVGVEAEILNMREKEADQGHLEKIKEEEEGLLCIGMFLLPVLSILAHFSTRLCKVNPKCFIIKIQLLFLVSFAEFLVANIS